MTETEQDATFFSGDTVELQFTVEDTDGNPVDVSSSTLEYALARRDGTVELTKTTSGGGITVSGTDNNVVTVTLQPADTEDLADTFVHELEETDGSGAVATLATGNVHIREDVVQ